VPALTLCSVLALAQVGPLAGLRNQTWFLGRTRQERLYAELRPTLLTEHNGVRTVDEKLVFWAVKGNKTVRRTSRDLGYTFYHPSALDVGLYLRNGRKQLFISLTMGAVRSWVFDFNGRRLRVPYENTIGRVSTSIAPDDHGGWQIVELWPKYQYEDEFHGRPFVVRPDGCVLRRVPLRKK